MATPRNPAFEKRSWTSADGVRLAYRDYPGGDDGHPPILCIPGLTRNARDFEDLAARLAGAWRVIAVDLRGRGESGYAKDASSYVPASYVRDVAALLATLALARVVAFGTSLGGIVTMLLAQARPGCIAAALLNDIGPVVEPAGLSRIRGYVGRASSWPTWMHAARALAEAQADIYPRFGVEDWLAMAKRLYRLTGSGRIVLDYDMKIAEPFRTPGGEAGPDMWAAFDALAGIPLTIVRGERSDVLGEATARAMAARHAGAELATVPDVGHAPLLTEPAARDAIDRLLARTR